MMGRHSTVSVAQTDIVLVVGIVSVHQLQQLHLDARLVHKRLLVLHHLDGDVLRPHRVISLHHLTQTHVID